MKDAEMDKSFYDKLGRHRMNPMMTISPTGEIREVMTLRDHFAGLAMQQFIAGARLPENYDAADEFRMCSERAYEMADAMLKQRSLTND